MTALTSAPLCTPVCATDVQALVLAGGQSRRMGHNKAWVSWQGHPLIEHVTLALRRQVPVAPGHIWLSAAQSDPRHAALGLAGVLPDPSAYAGAGPLAGLLAGLGACTSDWLLVVPCDTPRLPTDLLARLTAAVDAAHPLAVAATTIEGECRVHPVVALVHRQCAKVIEQQLEQGDRRLMHWLQRQPHRVVAFENSDAFANVNDAQALHDLGE